MGVLRRDLSFYVLTLKMSFRARLRAGWEHHEGEQKT